MLTERVANDPRGALERWLGTRAGNRPVDQLGPAVFDLAAQGIPVEEMAPLVGFSVRQLHRRCLPVFGYGSSTCAECCAWVERSPWAATACPWPGWPKPTLSPGRDGLAATLPRSGLSRPDP